MPLLLGRPRRTEVVGQLLYLLYPEQITSGVKYTPCAAIFPVERNKTLIQKLIVANAVESANGNI